MKAEELTPEDLAQFGTLLDTQQSDSDPSMHYEIRWNKETGYHCECAGWGSIKRSGKRPIECRHIKRFLFKYKLEQRMFEMDTKGFVDFQSEGAMKDVIRACLKTAISVWEV